MRVSPMSWRQAFDPPAGVIKQAIAQAIVQSVQTSLPEFDGGWHDAIAAPERRTRDRPVAELSQQLRASRFQNAPIGDDLALRRGPGADAAAARPALEIGVGF